MNHKTSKQPLAELTEMLKALQEKEKIQDSLVRKFQRLIRDEGLSSSVSRDFPYPPAAMGISTWRTPIITPS